MFLQAGAEKSQVLGNQSGDPVAQLDSEHLGHDRGEIPTENTESTLDLASRQEELGVGSGILCVAKLHSPMNFRIRRVWSPDVLLSHDIANRTDVEWIVTSGEAHPAGDTRRQRQLSRRVQFRPHVGKERPIDTGQFVGPIENHHSCPQVQGNLRNCAKGPI